MNSFELHYNDPTRKVKQLCLIIPFPPPHVEHQLVAFQAHTCVYTVTGRENVAPAQHPVLEAVSVEAMLSYRLLWILWLLINLMGSHPSEKYYCFASFIGFDVKSKA